MASTAAVVVSVVILTLLISVGVGFAAGVFGPLPTGNNQSTEILLPSGTQWAVPGGGPPNGVRAIPFTVTGRVQITGSFSSHLTTVDAPPVQVSAMVMNPDNYAALTSGQYSQYQCSTGTTAQGTFLSCYLNPGSYYLLVLNYYNGRGYTPDVVLVTWTTDVVATSA